MRHLVSVQKILNLETIVGADFIEKATVLGWSVVVRKGEFQIGDMCLYAEIDSVLPDKPEFEFLRAVNFRIKTTKRKGCVSQGICFSLHILPESVRYQVQEGQDLTEVLGVKKYEIEIPAQLAGKIKGGFPGFLNKTDEERIQSAPRVLDRWKGTQCYISEKCDGSSMTVYYKDGAFGVCSRNLDLSETEDNAYWKVARSLNLETKLAALPSSMSLQGELIGPGIQKNKYGLESVQFRVFNVFDINLHRYLDYKEFLDVVSSLELQTVPILDDKFTLNHSVADLVKLSEGLSVLNKATPREGIVVRPLVEAYDDDLHRLSFKVISPNFLLKYNE